MNEKIKTEQLKAYCERYISSTPYDIAIMELHRLLNCPVEDLEAVMKETVKYLQDWCERNEVK